MTYGYIRVSTDKQTVENQRFELSKFCEKNNTPIDKWVSETITGTKSINERAFGGLLKKMRKGDVLVCSELSRLGRNLFMIMSILNACMEKEVQVWAIKEGYKLGNDISSKVLAFAFGLSAEIERNLISQRTTEALARKKAEGFKLGRPKGAYSKELKEKLYSKHAWIMSLERQGWTTAQIARQIGVPAPSLYRYFWDRRIR